MTKHELYVHLATLLVGIRETGGANRGPHIEEFLRSVKLEPGQSWCLAFQRWLVLRVDEMFGGAPSDLPLTGWTVGLLEWAQKRNRLLPDPAPGRIILWRRWLGAGQPTSYGHAGCVASVREHLTWPLVTIEGNTAPTVGIQREGDGVYQLERGLAPFNGLRLEGYIDPWGVAP